MQTKRSISGNKNCIRKYHSEILIEDNEIVNNGSLF